MKKFICLFFVGLLLFTISCSSENVNDQKEVEIDVNNFLEGVNSAIDQDPDVIMVSHISGDPQTFSAVLSAAENVLVIIALQTPDTISTIEYILGMYPQDKRDHIKIQLCSVLVSIISQSLIPSITGYGNILATEVMLANQAMKNLILENKTHQIPAVIKTSKSLGMMTMEDSINELYAKQLIS
jgi:twitching motility protein PilT